jgi:hypothetical protein
MRVPPGMQPLALGAEALACGVPQENGAKKEKGDVLELSDNRGIRRSRAGAATGASERSEVYRSFCGNAAILEKRAGRMGLEDRVAPRRDLPAAACGIRAAVGRERLARPGGRQPDQLDLRASERQRQEGPGGQAHLLVHSRRRRAQARSRRTGAGSGTPNSLASEESPEPSGASY